MAKNTLPVNFKDDIMNSSMGGKRRYKMINNSDGTISLEDATTYDQVGSNFGASQMNATNQAVNAAADAGKIIDDIDAIRNVTKEGYMAGALALKQVDESLVAQDNLKFQFATDGEGNYGYLGADDRFIPFKSTDLKNVEFHNLTNIQLSGNTTITKTIPTDATSFDIIITSMILRNNVIVFGGVDITGGYIKKELIYSSVPTTQSTSSMDIYLVYHIEKESASDLTVTISNKVKDYAIFFVMANILK